VHVLVLTIELLFIPSQNNCTKMPKNLNRSTYTSIHIYIYAYSLCVSDKSGYQKSATINILQRETCFGVSAYYCSCSF